ncbi:DUF2281 domain-containing protein [Coleofasciculus sp. F4-SAH-05]|uniref:DUF2281 domain-containing protein n=1 Tax=Coleofasciculus sp. F4-SAH-05 TaxID=3069525 RepID=UPI0032FE4403
MLTLDQLIAEATALPDADKAILIDKLTASMDEQRTASKTASIPPGTLTKLRGIAKRSRKTPSDEELQAEYTDYLVQKYQ